jgi:hypothetical protein
MRWLCLAQDLNGDAGVAGTYTLLKGWTRSFPETTGYIVPTFLAYGRHRGRDEFVERGLRMADWLLTLQAADGSYFGGLVGGRQSAGVFDTGQILFGLLDAYRVTATAAYLDAAVAAGRWLTSIQEPDGAWPGRYDFMGRQHAYNSRVAWPLLLLARASGEARFEAAAEKHVRWVLEQADPDGYFDRAAFDPDRPRGLRSGVATVVRDRALPSFYRVPSLHTLAYTIEGLLESGRLLGDSAAVRCAELGAAALAGHARSGRLAGFYGPGWAPSSRSVCLTGVAQMALVWMSLHAEGSHEYLAAADVAVTLLLDAQRMSDRPRRLKGAVAGSKPLYGAYLPFRYPNWAAKFTADAYLARLELLPA